MTTRVRLADRVGSLPRDASAVALPPDAALTWRESAAAPAGDAVALGDLQPGTVSAVEIDRRWHEVLVLGDVARPIGGGWWLVDGDVGASFAARSVEDLEREHGPLARGDQRVSLYSDDGRDMTVGDPLTREEVAAARGCSPDEAEQWWAALSPAERLAEMTGGIVARAWARRD